MKRYEIYTTDSNGISMSRHTGSDDFEDAKKTADFLRNGGLEVRVFDTKQLPTHVNPIDRNGEIDATLCKKVY